MKMKDLKAGMKIRARYGLPCMDRAQVFTVEAEGKDFFVRCKQGKHYLEERPLSYLLASTALDHFEIA